ncbi:MAG TPA: glycoside hydrolase family 15 protein [Frankiaceae bacterium]
MADDGRPGARRPTREDGYAPLRDYAGLGDGRSVALVALDGSVDWWALPDLDSTPAFGALLDAAEGGRIELAPTDPFTADRRYVGATNVVETVFTTDGGRVRVTDALNTGVAGRLPWSELARRVEGLAGTVPMAWRIAPGNGLGRLSPWTRDDDRGPLLKLDDVSHGVRSAGVGDPVVGPRDVRGAFEARRGSRGILGVVATSGEPLHLPDPEALDRRIDRTVRGWQDWSDTFSWHGPFQADVLRSALALKLLIHAPTGSIAAAATTSVPERIGGPKNWDYRYTWVRDTAYTLDAFIRCGLHEEVHAAVAWLLATLERNKDRLHPFYTLAGGIPPRGEERDVPGYRRSRPVVCGNDATTQLQLGPYGDVFQMVLLAVQDSHVLDVGTQRLLSDLADRCCDEWQRRDAGMWELPEEAQYTVSKMSCWQALDRAAQLADLGQLPGDGLRWRREADRVRAWVGEHCWSERRQAYVMAEGSDALDAGVLLGARFGFDRGPRMTSTLQAVRDELGRGPMFYRYTGMAGEGEGAFVACTFWAVEALALTGQRKEAVALMEEALQFLGGAHLLSEMVEPHTGDFLGNLPQALSHLALINAASALAETAG